MKTKYFLIFIFSAGIIIAQTNLSGKYRLAKNYESAGNFEQAESLYLELYDEQPWNYQYLESLNNLYLRLKNYEKSVKLIETKLKDNPEDVLSLGMLGSTYHVMGDYQKAFSIWDRAVNMQPENSNNYRVIINYAVQNRAFDKAIELLEKARSNVKNPEAFLYDLANLYAQTMKYKDAAAEYCKILSAHPEHLEVLKNRFKAYLKNEDAFSQTIPVIEEQYDSKNLPELLELESYVYQLNGDYSGALNLLIDYDETIKDGTKIFQFAQASYSEGKYSAASKAFKYYLDNYPDTRFAPIARIGFAKNSEAMLNSEFDKTLPEWKPYYKKPKGEESGYRKIIRTYLEISNQSANKLVEAEALYRIGMIYWYRFNEADSALQYFTNPVLNDGNGVFSIDARLRTAEILIVKNETEEAVKLLNGISNENFNDNEKQNYTGLLKAKILFWQGKFKMSAELFDKCSTEMSSDYTNDALEQLLIINSCKNDSSSLAEYATADFMAYKNDFEGAGKIFIELSGNKNLFLLNQIAKVKYAEILCAEDRYEEATGSINEYLKDEQNILFRDKMMFLLGNIYRFGLSDKTKAGEVYQKLLEIFPNSLYLSKSRESINELN